MAYGTCDQCFRAFVIGDDQGDGARCPECNMALRRVTREEFLRRLGRAGKRIDGDDESEHGADADSQNTALTTPRLSPTL